MGRDISDSLLKSFGGNIEGAVLFGSTARRERRPESDIDILVFTRGEDRSQRDLRVYLALKPVRVKYRLDTTVVALDLEEVRDITPSLMNVAHDGIVLLDLHGKVEDLLGRIREAVRKAGLVRHRVKGAYGWKPERPLKPGEVVTVELMPSELPRRGRV